MANLICQLKINYTTHTIHATQVFSKQFMKLNKVHANLPNPSIFNLTCFIKLYAFQSVDVQMMSLLDWNCIERRCFSPFGDKPSDIKYRVQGLLGQPSANHHNNHQNLNFQNRNKKHRKNCETALGKG